MAKKKATDSEKLVDTIIHGIQEVKGNDIVCMDLRELPSAVTDFFIVCHGDSTTQVDAIASSVGKETSKKMKEKPWHIEGTGNSEWILLDYVSVVVHVFYREAREFYNLEALWADAKIKEISYEV